MLRLHSGYISDCKKRNWLSEESYFFLPFTYAHPFIKSGNLIIIIPVVQMIGVLTEFYAVIVDYLSGQLMTVRGFDRHYNIYIWNWRDERNKDVDSC